MASSQPAACRIVEVVGPAGAGKTTLLRALRDRHAGVIPGVSLTSVELVRYCAANSGFMLPLFLRHPFRATELTRANIRSMVYLMAWEDRLQKKERRRCITVFDQGPIFRLVFLRSFGPEITRCETFRRWCTDGLRRWSNILDMVIWLDAPDAILFDRINSRSSAHLMKGCPAQKAFDFLAHYRTEYLESIRTLERNPGITVLRFNTSQESAARIAEIVCQSLPGPADPC